jgi:radical SAM superfamily enzyme with C-terminal helix-hairpin-helix motif
MDELTAIPGIGKRTAGDIVVNRPYASADEVTAADVDLSKLTGSYPVEPRAD